MISIVRKFSQSWIAKILMGLLIVSFAAWGINDVFQSNRGTNVAIVNGEPITATDFKNEFDRFIKRASQESGQNITVQQAREAKQDIALLEQMVTEKAMGALMKIFGIHITDSRLRDEISKIPAFIDPTTGKFSDVAYEAALRENNYTISQFEQSMRNDMARQLFTVAAVSGLRAPKYYSSQTLAFSTERRYITMIPVTMALIGGEPKPTDKNLQDYYNSHKEQLMRPETRDFTLVVASLSDFIPKAHVAESEVQKVFNIKKNELATPAKRSFVQIVANDSAKANQAAAMLKAGKNPQQIASSLGLQKPLTFDNVAINQVPDKEVAKAVFAAQKGAIAPVKGALAYAAYKVTDAQAAKAADYATAAVEIRKELVKEQAGQLLTAATDKYEDALSQGDSVDKAAEKSGFKTEKLANITQGGQELNSGKKPEILANINNGFDEAFSLAQGDNTDLLAAKNDSYVAIRVDTVKPKAPVPFAEVKSQLAIAWTRDEVTKRIKAKADAILKDAQATSLEAAAKKHALAIVKPKEPLMRGQGSEALSAAVFGAKKGEIVTGPSANNVEYAIVRVDGIYRDDEKLAKARLQQAEQAVRSSIQDDIMETFSKIARDRTKTKTFKDRLNQIFGDNTAN